MLTGVGHPRSHEASGQTTFKRVTEMKQGRGWLML
jgi:hypothetical protein